MTQYAVFDHTQPEPRVVDGWYDNAYPHPVEPVPEDLLEMTEAEWDGRMKGRWAVTGGALIPWNPPPPEPTPAEIAGAIMNQPVTVTCPTNATLEAIYANNVGARQAMLGIVSQVNAGLGLPGGGGTFNYSDIDGAERLWSEIEFVAYASAVTQFVYACDQTVGGFSTDVPSSVLVVDVPASQAARRRLNWAP